MAVASRSFGNGRVLFLAPLPPPHHGQSAMAAEVAGVLARDAGLTVVRKWRGGAASAGDIGRRTPAKYLGFLRLLGELAAGALAGRRYDIAYVGMAPWAHSVVRDAILAGAGRLVARRVWLHVHGDGLAAILAGTGLRDRLIRVLIGGAELLAITGGTARLAEESGVFSRVVAVPNTVADPGPAERKPRPPLTIGCLANLDPRKGVIDVVGAVATLARLRLPVRAVIAGGDTPALSLDELRREIARRRAASRIEVVGHVAGAEKSALLAGLDIFLYLSRHDLAPLALIEAMAHGAVPIVLDVGGMREIVGPGLAGNVLDPAADRSALMRRVAGVVRGYLADPKRLAADRIEARRRYLEAYRPDLFALRLAALAREERPGAARALDPAPTEAAGQQP